MDRPGGGGAPTIDPAEWARPTLDAVRSELAALHAMVARQQATLDRVAQVDADVAELATVLPSRLGEAIAAAIEARQDAYLGRLEEVVSDVRAGADELRGSLRGALDDLAALGSRAAEQVTLASERVGDLAGSADRVTEIAGRLDVTLGDLPHRLDSGFEAGRTQLTDLLTQLGSELHTRLSQLDGAIESAATVTRESAEATAARVEEIGPQIDRRVEDAVGEVRSLGDAMRVEIGARVDDSLTGLRPALERLATAEQAQTMSESMARLRDAVATGPTDETMSGLTEQVRRAVTAAAETAGATDLAAVAHSVGTVLERLSRTAEAERLEAVHILVSEIRSSMNEAGRAELVAMREALSNAVERLESVPTTSDLDVVVRDALVAEGVDALRAQLEGLQRSVVDLAAAGEETAPPSVIVDLSPVESRLGDVSQRLEEMARRLEALETLAAQDAGPVAGVTALADHLTRIEAALAGRADIGSLAGSLADIDRRLVELGESVAADAATGSTGDEEAGAVRAALSELNVRMAAFTDELAVIERAATTEQVAAIEESIRPIADLSSQMATSDDLEIAVDRIASLLAEVTSGLDDTALRARLDDLHSLSAEAGLRIAELPDRLEAFEAALSEPIDLDLTDLLEQVAGVVEERVAAHAIDAPEAGRDVAAVLERIETLAATLSAGPTPATPQDLAQLEERLHMVIERVEQVGKMVARLRPREPRQARTATRKKSD